jgi:hypothetical protein
MSRKNFYCLFSVVWGLLAATVLWGSRHLAYQMTGDFAPAHLVLSMGTWLGALGGLMCLGFAAAAWRQRD